MSTTTWLYASTVYVIKPDLENTERGTGTFGEAANLPHTHNNPSKDGWFHFFKTNPRGKKI